MFDPESFDFPTWAEMASERILNESTYASALNSNFKMVLPSELTSYTRGEHDAHLNRAEFQNAS